MTARGALHLTTVLDARTPEGGDRVGVTAVRANGRGVTVTFHRHAPPTVEHCGPGSGPVPTRRGRGVDPTPQARP